MANPQLDTHALANGVVQRIRTASRQQLNEAQLAKTASDQRRRTRVILELVEIRRDLSDLDPLDREEVERKAGAAFDVPAQFGRIIKEASIDALGSLGSYWAQFYAALGL